MLVVGQKQLYVREHGVRKDVVLTGEGVTGKAVVPDLVVVTENECRKREHNNEK